MFDLSKAKVRLAGSKVRRGNPLLEATRIASKAGFARPRLGLVVCNEEMAIKNKKLYTVMVRALALMMACFGLSKEIQAQTAVQSPAQVQSSYDYPLAVGRQFVCSRANDGNLKCAGYSLWAANRSPGNSFQNVGLTANSVTMVSAGENGFCAVTNNAVRCTGVVGGGQTFALSQSVADAWNSGVTAVAANASNICVIKAGGVQCIGSFNGLTDVDYQQLAIGPKPLASLDSGVSRIAIGRQELCAIKSGGLWCTRPQSNGSIRAELIPGFEQNVTGLSMSSEGGNIAVVHEGAVKVLRPFRNLLTASFDLPGTVAGLSSNVKTVAVSETHLCAIQSGALKCLGNGAYGALGSGNYTDVISGSLLVTPAALSENVIALAVFNNKTCAIVQGNPNKLFCFGENEAGEITNSAQVWSVTTPKTISGLSSTTLPSSLNASSNERSGSVIQNGKLFRWGAHQSVTAVPSSSSSGPLFPSYTNVKKVIQSSDGSVYPPDNENYLDLNPEMLIENGKLYAKGRGVRLPNSGEDVSMAETPFFTILTGPANVLDAAHDVNGGCVVEGATPTAPAGGVKCWGWNGSGRVTCQSSTGYCPITSIQNLSSGVTKVAEINLGESRCAIQSGKVFCWGRNHAGQLGTEAVSVPDSSTPLQVPSLTGVTDLVAHQVGFCALKTRSVNPILLREVLCWGNGNSFPARPQGLSIGEYAKVATDKVGLGVYVLSSGAIYKSGGNTPVPVPGFSSGVVDFDVGQQGNLCATFKSGIAGETAVTYSVRCIGDNVGGGVGASRAFRFPSPMQMLNF